MGLGVTRRGVEYIHSYSLHKVIGWVGLGGGVIGELVDLTNVHK